MKNYVYITSLFKDLVEQQSLLVNYYESEEVNELPEKEITKLYLEIKRLEKHISVLLDYFPREVGVKQYNVYGDLVREFPTVKYASHFIGIDSFHIRNSMKGFSPLIKRTFFVSADSLSNEHINQLPWVKIRKKQKSKVRN